MYIICYFWINGPDFSGEPSCSEKSHHLTLALLKQQKNLNYFIDLVEMLFTLIVSIS